MASLNRDIFFRPTISMISIVGLVLYGRGSNRYDEIAFSVLRVPSLFHDDHAPTHVMGLAMAK